MKVSFTILYPTIYTLIVLAIILMSQLYYNLTILNTSYNWQILEYECNI